MFPFLLYASTPGGQYIRPPPCSETGAEERKELQLSALCYSGINTLLCATVSTESVGCLLSF